MFDRPSATLRVAARSGNAGPFDLKGLSLDRLRAFLAVVDAGGSIARAAPGDPVRQSQLSRQIGELEAWFGHALIASVGTAGARSDAERRGGTIARRAPTAPGRQLAVIVRELIAGLGEIASRRAHVEVALGAGDSVLHAWLIPRLPRIDATVALASMHGPEVVARLREARLDVGVAPRADVGRDLRTRAIGELALALFVPRGLRVRGSPAHVMASVPLASQYGDAEAAAAVEAIAPGVVPALRCETFPQAQRAVMTGRFAAVLPALVELPRSDYERLALPIPARAYVVAWHPRLERQRPRVAALVPAMVAAFAR